MSTLTDPQHREYRALRRDGMPAMRALQTIRLRETYRGALKPFGEWQWPLCGEYGAFAYADVPSYGYTIRVLVGDDDCPTDWGDCEPTDDERDATRSYYVAVQVLDEQAGEIYHDGIGGVDAMDLPHSSVRDWEDAAGYALTEYLMPSALRFTHNEHVERIYWERRDVVTVEA